MAVHKRLKTAAFSLIEPVIILALFVSMIAISFVSFSRTQTTTPKPEAPSDSEWGVQPPMTGSAQSKTNQTRIHITQTAAP